MKNRKTSFAAPVVTFVACTCFAACGSKDTPPPQPAAQAEAARPAPAKVAREKFDKTAADAKGGKADEAALESGFRAVVEADEKVVEAQYNLGVLAQQAGRADDAESRYKKALQFDPKFGPAAENLAAVMVNRGQVEDAQKMLEGFIANEPAATGPRVALARIYRDKKRYEDGISQCRLALQREPKNLGAFETLAQLYADAGNLPMAKLVAARGFKVNDRDAVLHHTLGRIFLAENKIPEAVAALKNSLAGDPTFRPARIDLAETALTYRDFGNAKDNYVELLKSEPNDPGLLLGLGIANKGLGQYEDAKTAYKKVLEKNPQHSVALLDLAILHHRNLNDFQGALDYYKLYQQKPVDDGPKPELLKGYIMELEATIAALKEAEKLQQMAEAQAKEAEKQQQQQGAQEQAPAPEGQAPTPTPEGQGATPAPQNQPTQ